MLLIIQERKDANYSVFLGAVLPIDPIETAQRCFLTSCHFEDIIVSRQDSLFKSLATTTSCAKYLGALACKHEKGRCPSYLLNPIIPMISFGAGLANVDPWDEGTALE